VADPKLELFEAIRQDARRGDSIRELAERYGVHRRTVRQAMDAAMPGATEKPGAERRLGWESPFLSHILNGHRNIKEADVVSVLVLCGVKHEQREKLPQLCRDQKRQGWL
jgi:transposase-like protein